MTQTTKAEQAAWKYFQEFGREVNSTKGRTVTLNYRIARLDPDLLNQAIHYAITSGKTVQVVWLD